MALTKGQKNDILKDLIEQIKSAKSTVFADFQGVSVKDMGTLRAKMRESGVKYKVAKKTLIRLAAKEAGVGEIPAEALEGPVGAAFSMEDEIAAARIFHTFAKTNKNLKLRGAIFEGRVLSVKETLALATLPGKEELLAKLVYLLNYPIQSFHGVLNNTTGGFVRVLNAIKEQKSQTT